MHKGLSGGSRYSSPMDIGPAARTHRDANFVVYHSGYESGTFEGPYTAATAEVGVNRLIASLERAGIGPNENVYAELGTTWWNVMRTPTQAAHVLGKLLKHVGEDNVVWGTDCLFYGSPQPQIQAFRAFRITEEFQERYGYPELTKELKAKVLGRNAARLYGIEPVPPGATSPGGSSRGSARTFGTATGCSAPRRSWPRRTSASTTGWRSRARLALEVGRGELVPVRPSSGSAPRPAPRGEREGRPLSMPAPSANVSPAANESPAP